ncbi:MAG: aspartate/glutamate racemase family protein [Proteobacteria bacterium]|nr:aspartate/glutamate racemase family protein [Pseudomonadota bacterium]
MPEGTREPEFAAESRDNLRLAEGAAPKPVALYSAYGWRGRVGLISPSTNSTLEPEFYRMAPAGVSIHTSRVLQLGRQQDESYRIMAEGIARASRELATVEVDVIAFGCTSCTYFVSADEISATMNRLAGVPAIVTAQAVVRALKALGAKRVALGSPRTDYVTGREVKFLEESGFEVVSVHAMTLGETEAERRAIGRVPPRSMLRLARTIDRPEADVVFISCTQLPTVEMIAGIEEALEKPVVGSNQATFWSCLRLMGLNTAVPGFGRLLAEH